MEKISEQEYKLEIEHSQLSDAGAYRVVLSTETESVESSSTVTVAEKITEPTFTKGLEDATVPKGSSLSLEVSVLQLVTDSLNFTCEQMNACLGICAHSFSKNKYKVRKYVKVDISFVFSNIF